MLIREYGCSPFWLPAWGSQWPLVLDNSIERFTWSGVGKLMPAIDFNNLGFCFEAGSPVVQPDSSSSASWCWAYSSALPHTVSGNAGD